MGGRGSHATYWHSCYALKFRVCLFIHVSVAMALRVVCCVGRSHTGAIAAAATYAISSRVVRRVLERGKMEGERREVVPFEELPNLPKPVIPRIDLGIERTDVLALQ